MNDAVNPLKYGDNQYFELELRDLNKISFGVADSPFEKTEAAKFYPELHVINGEGKILATINP